MTNVAATERKPPMDLQLTNKKAVVTGSTAGIGLAIASLFAEEGASVRPSSLRKRFATPEEVAAMVVYVCSPRASATNGAALRVDGGVVRSIV
jgi:NAD(P)-dependent dehydrogenase (short-subunit alcohol dehydrogenase family)